MLLGEAKALEIYLLLLILQALSELHDQIPPFPRAEALKIIEEELGAPAHSIFSYISEEPVAAASFGQVTKLIFEYEI